MKMTIHIRRSANTKILKNVTKNTKKSAATRTLRFLITNRSRFLKKFAILKSTLVILEAVLTQTFIPDTLDSVPQDTTPDKILDLVTPDTIPDTTPDTALAVSVLADRFVFLIFFKYTFPHLHVKWQKIA